MEKALAGGERRARLSKALGGQREDRSQHAARRGSATRVTDGDTDGITDRGKHIDRSCGVVKKSTNLPHVVLWYIEHSVGAEMCNCEADKTNYKI